MEMRFLFVTLPAYGHIKPLVSIALYLQDLGHKIFFISSNQMKDFLGNFNFTVFLTDTHYVEMNRKRTSRLPYRKQISDENFLLSAIEFEKKIIKEFKINLIFTDSLISVPISANLTNAKWVSHFLGPSWFSRNKPFFGNSDTTIEEKSIQKVIEKFKINKISPKWPQIMFSPFLNLCSGLDSFADVIPVEDRIIPKNLYFLGGLTSGINRNPFGKCDTKIDALRIKSSIFISLGTLSSDINNLQLIINATSGIKFDKFIISSGIVDSNEIAHTDIDKYFVCDFIPFESIHHYIKLAIIHGGYNSIIDCLKYSIPMVVLPSNRSSDQIFNGEMITKLGFGNIVSYPYSINKIQASVKSTLDNKIIENSLGKIRTDMNNSIFNKIYLLIQDLINDK